MWREVATQYLDGKNIPEHLLKRTACVWVEGYNSYKDSACVLVLLLLATKKATLVLHK